MGKVTANRKAPSESLTSKQRIGTRSPLMNWMEMNRQPETTSTGRFRLKCPSFAQRILFIPLRSMFSFLRSPKRAIGAGIVVVAMLALIFVFRPAGSANIQLDDSEIHFDDVTIHPLHSNSAVTAGWSNQDEKNLSNFSALHSSVSAAENNTEIPPIQPVTFTIQNSPDGEHGAWLTGTIEFDETSQSRSLPNQDRIGQHIEYFSQNRD